MRAKVFIGSSTRGLNVAEAIQRELSHESDPVLWSQGIFNSTNVPIEDLMAAINTFDIAIFVFLPEDATTIRDQVKSTVRDNVIFELGLFLGKLGRHRNFFVTPRLSAGASMHLPSDLSGISPAMYNPDSDNLQAAIGAALYDVKAAIRRLGSIGKEYTIYDSQKDFKPYYFKAKNTYKWKGKKKVSEICDGILNFPGDGVLMIERKNSDGRYEIELRKNGPEVPSLPKKHDPTYRTIKMSCDLKVNTGSHQLRFVLKDIKENEWLAKQVVTIDNTDWARYEHYFRVSPTADMLFRIDHEDPTIVPSCIYIKNLVIAEEG